MNEQKQPNYGVVDRYLDENGQDYFEWQSQYGLNTGLYNKHLWQPLISLTDEVLDFGCGGGFLLKVLDTEGRKVGVEINPYARASAQRLGIETYESVENVSGKFDKVISSHALEHIPHPRQALLELKDKLRDENSRLVLLLPIDDWRSRANRRYDSSDINMHLYTWTPQLLGNLLKSCGLEVLGIRVVKHAWPPRSELIWSISPALFHAMAYIWSGINKQRQLMAVAKLS